jgi:hypothetical protein
MLPWDTGRKPMLPSDTGWKFCYRSLNGARVQIRWHRLSYGFHYLTSVTTRVRSADVSTGKQQHNEW